MAPQPRSIHEVVERLVQEFDGTFGVRAVTDVVKQLSGNGAVSLTVLADMAHQELTALAAADPHGHPPPR